MEWKLWTMALILALLKTKLDFSHGGMEGNATLETQGFNFTKIKITHPPVPVSGNSFPCDITRTPLPPVTDGDTDGTPLITKGANHSI